MSLKKIVLAIIMLSLLTLPLVSLAEGNLGTAQKLLDGTATGAGIKDKADLPVLVGTIINVALSFVGIIFLVLMVYAGFLWMTAQGEEEKVKTAQKIVTTCIIGLLIVLSAYAITFLVTKYLGTG